MSSQVVRMRHLEHINTHGTNIAVALQPLGHDLNKRGKLLLQSVLMI
jgi:hypothetical protein